MTTERIADHIKFAYWVPNVSGGLVTSDIEQRTDWNYEYNKKLAQTAENNGFEYALSPGPLRGQLRRRVPARVDQLQPRTAAGHRAAQGHRRRPPRLWQPAVLAKLGATADHLSNGRFAVNVVSGWFKDEFTHLGEPWLEHDERYRRSAEFLQVLRKIWTEDDVDFRGDFYRIHDFTLKPKPLNTPDRPNPEICSRAATRPPHAATAGRYSDWYFSNGKDFDGVTEQVVEVRDHARDARPRGQVRAQRIHHRPRHREGSPRHPARDHREGQQARGRGIPRRRPAGRQLHRRQEGMWADSTFEDLVQYNDGFRTQLIGTPEQIAERIAAYRKRGVDLILGGFLHFQEEIEYFGANVLPLVREIEAAEANSRASRAVTALSRHESLVDTTGVR